MFKQIAMATIASAALAGSAQATVHTFDCVMDGAQETPPVATPASGVAVVTLDDVTGQVTVVSGSYTGLIGTCSDSHIHGPAGPGVPAGIIIGITNTGGNNGTLGGGGILSATNQGHLLAGNTYINVHSTFRPGGEIRGQLILRPAAVPTVSEWGMMVLGLVTLTGGTLVIRRRMAQPALAV